MPTLVPNLLPEDIEVLLHSENGVLTVGPSAFVLRGLQDMGAVARPARVSSGRALPAQVTGDGVTLLQRAEAALRVADERVLANLTPADRREFKRLLNALGSGQTDRAP